MGNQAKPEEDGAFKCIFGHAKTQYSMCWQFENVPFGHLDHLQYFGYFRADTRAHFLLNKTLPAAEFRRYFNQRGTLTPDERKALAISPRLTKMQTKKLMGEFHTRHLLMQDVTNLMRHDILPEIVEAWGERVLPTLSLAKELKEERYWQLLDFEPNSAGCRIEVADEDGRWSYPAHWDTLAMNEATPPAILIELFKREPSLRNELLYRVGSLPIELYFQIPEVAFERTQCLEAMEDRESEVRSWLEAEHPEMVDVPFEWVFEVLSPKEW